MCPIILKPCINFEDSIIASDGTGPPFIDPYSGQSFGRYNYLDDGSAKATTFYVPSILKIFTPSTISPLPPPSSHFPIPNPVPVPVPLPKNVWIRIAQITAEITGLGLDCVSEAAYTEYDLNGVHYATSTYVGGNLKIYIDKVQVAESIDLTLYLTYDLTNCMISGYGIATLDDSSKVRLKDITSSYSPEQYTDPFTYNLKFTLVPYLEGDSDEDGIIDVLDPDPYYSDNFSNPVPTTSRGGTNIHTAGTISKRGTKIVTVKQASNPSGVLIKAENSFWSGAVYDAEIKMTGDHRILLKKGSEVETELGTVSDTSIWVKATLGRVKVKLRLRDGTLAVAEILQGDGLTFDPVNSEIDAPAQNSQSIDVTAHGQISTVTPGTTIQI